MRKILATACFALLVSFFSAPVYAQSQSPVVLPGGCGTASFISNSGYPTEDSTGKLCVNATVSASISPFTPGASGARGTQLSVTTADSSGSLPTNGGAVVVTNTGSNPIYCNVNGNAATTSDQEVTASGGWFNFGIPSGVTTLHCIATGGSSTANSLGGSGLATGTGGGGGGGGGGTVAQGTGGASAWLVTGTGGTFPVTGTFWQATQPVSVASGAVASGAYAPGAFQAGAGADGWDTAEGTTTSTACPVSGTATVVGCLRSAVNNPVTLGSASGGISTKTLAALTNTAIAVKAAAGQVYSAQCSNSDATHWAYIQIFNVAAASVTMGTTAPTKFVGIPPASNAGFTFSLVGDQYSTAISAGAASTSTGGTAPTTAIDCTVDFL